MSTQFRICSCNRSMPLTGVSGQRLGEALHCGPLPVATQLCGRDSAQYLEALQGTDTVVVACTQESALFRELADESGSGAPLRFVNIRETAGWGAQAPAALPKMAALLADAARLPPSPVPAVSYTSHGRVLIIGAADRALPWAEQLSGQPGEQTGEQLSEQLSVSVLITAAAAGDSLPLQRGYPLYSGAEARIRGRLGAFQVAWRQDNPIDLDLCVRCNACIASCPENAIGLSYQVDAGLCQRHGACVQACGAVGAIDFTRGAQQRSGEYDLILDLSDTPLLSMHQPPQGYFAPGKDLRAQLQTVMRLSQMVGEFEKPKYFKYTERLCAHGRNRKTGCTACVDICSAQAIEDDGDHVRVDPHLCLGCGACTTVCPSGALSYANPDVPYAGARLKSLLSAYRSAGGENACLLFYDPQHGAELIGQLGRLAQTDKSCKGVPAHVIPLELHHIASTGIDVWLAALCFGASGVGILATGHEAPQYADALKRQSAIAQAILSGLGYQGVHVQVIEARLPRQLDAALQQLAPADVPQAAARFNLFPEKRNTLDFVLDHLFRHAPIQNQRIPLPPGAPFGSLAVDADRCTLCMACSGACPASALLTTADRPQLRFIEKNCIQCGLCAQSCPEDAIALVPQLVPADTARQPVILNEAEPFHCIRCHKPIGTLKVIESILTRLGGHPAFAANPDLIKMCGDCRVTDMMKAGRPPTIAR